MVSTDGMSLFCDWGGRIAREGILAIMAMARKPSLRNSLIIPEVVLTQTKSCSLLDPRALHSLNDHDAPVKMAACTHNSGWSRRVSSRGQGSEY